MKRYRHDPNGGIVPHEKGPYVDADIALEAEREIEELREKNSELLYIIHELYAMGFLTETFDSGCDHKAVCRKAHKLLKD